MPPPKPKSSSQRGGELPFSDDEILKADDPRPQHVAQYPSSGARRGMRRKSDEAIPTSVFDTERHDEEMKASYGGDHDLGYKPVFLYVERGPGQGQLVQLKQGALVVGRASVSDLRLQHPSISRRHAQVTRVGEQFYVKDLSSQNGTFVNKQRIATEIEIIPGDTIAMGNALLKLRGPLQKGEHLPGMPRASAPAAPVRAHGAVRSAPGKKAPQSSNAVKIAIFAGAVGFGLAAMLMVAVFNLPSSGRKPSRPVSQPIAEKTEGDNVVMIESAEVRAKVDDTIAKAMEEQRKVQAAKAATSGDTTPAPAPAPVGGKAGTAVANRSARAAADDAFADEASTPAKGGTKRSEALKTFEQGDAEEALQQAKAAHEQELADRLGKFITSYDAAAEAVASGNGTAAIKNYEAALKQAEQISPEWSKYSAIIHQKLSGLYVLVAQAHQKNGDDEAAKKAYVVAFKHDPNNAQAKAEVSAAAAPKKSAAAAADSEFGSESEPAKKASAKKPAPKSRAQAIDDAFGD